MNIRQLLIGALALFLVFGLVGVAGVAAKKETVGVDSIGVCGGKVTKIGETNRMGHASSYLTMGDKHGHWRTGAGSE